MLSHQSRATAPSSARSSRFHNQLVYPTCYPAVKLSGHQAIRLSGWQAIRCPLYRSVHEPIGTHSTTSFFLAHNADTPTRRHPPEQEQGGHAVLTLIAASILASCPVHSIATLIGIPITSLISSTASVSVPGLTNTVRTRGNKFLANSKREAEMSVMTMGAQPAASAQSRVRSPIGPAPLHLSFWSLAFPRRISSACGLSGMVQRGC